MRTVRVSNRACAAVLAAGVLVAQFGPTTAFASGDGSKAAGKWVKGPSPEIGRTRDFTSTLLKDGRVLLLGGAGPEVPALTSGEIFDPVKGTWKPAAPMLVARSGHTATALNDGRVLVAGGYGLSGVSEVLGSAEVYDPTSNKWTGVADIGRALFTHTATLLADGRVMLIGGRTQAHLPAHREVSIFDPAQGTWSAAAPLELGRSEHTAILMKDKRVVVVGGRVAGHDESLRDAVIYDPKADSWTAAPTLMKEGRAGHTATVLPSGRVLIVGGIKVYIALRAENMLSSAELFDPDSLAFKPAPNPGVRRMFHSASALGNGRVLVAGGFPDGNRLELPISSKIYDPLAGRWEPGPRPTSPPGYHTATVLTEKPCGRRCGDVVLVRGSDTGKSGALMFQSQSTTGSETKKAPGGRGLILVLALGAIALGGAVLIFRSRKTGR